MTIISTLILLKTFCPYLGIVAQLSITFGHHFVRKLFGFAALRRLREMSSFRSRVQLLRRKSPELAGLFLRRSRPADLGFLKFRRRFAHQAAPVLLLSLARRFPSFDGNFNSKKKIYII